jgi:hypothetical protein
MKRYIAAALAAVGILWGIQGTAHSSEMSWHHFRTAWLQHRGIHLMIPLRHDPSLTVRAWSRYRREVIHRAYARWEYRLAHPQITVQIQAPTPPPRNYGIDGCASGAVHDLIVRDFPPSQLAEAFFIARRESDCDPYAKNRYSSASGVYQIVAGTWAYWSPRCGFGGESPFNANANVGTAACMVRYGGWGPWGG